MSTDDFSALQESHYAEGVDYIHGSPHLSDARLREELTSRLREALQDLNRQGLPLRVLEIGAGHGGYTEPVLAAGGHVTAVDMSRPALAELQSKFGSGARLECHYTRDGNLDGVGDDYTLLLCVAVLHHIPDYLSFLQGALAHLRPGAAVLILQDPLWYPRLPRGVHLLDRTGYLAWRLFQGNLKQGLASLFRRVSHQMREDRPGDMVEYHVLRQGVDEEALVSVLEEHFEDVNLYTYWSNQLPLGQTIGRRSGLANSFGVHARRYQVSG